MTSWPTPEAMTQALGLPPGTLRTFADAELDALPALLRRWYPAIGTGAESVFLEPDLLRASFSAATRDASDFWACAICVDGALAGFQAFERDRRAAVLHGRLGVLAPEARAGTLGALGFVLFEALGRALGAESLQVFVTLAFKGQQLFAERRGFTLAGLAPAFDRDVMPDGSVKRVMEALYVKTLVPDAELSWPAPDALTPRTKAALAALFPERFGAR